MPEPEVLWQERGSRTEEEITLSPEQVSPQAYVRKFYTRQVPTAMVLVYAYVIRTPEDVTNDVWTPEMKVRYIVGSDSADVPGTEVWAYEAITTGSLNGEPIPWFDAAWGDALGRIQMYHQENIVWNGTTGTIGS